MPLRAYRHDKGWSLGRTFLELVHTGRKTGRQYEVVAMVLRYDADAHEAVIVAGWGPDTDWVRNLHAGPAVRVRLGRETFVPEHRFLSEDDAFDVVAQFRRSTRIGTPGHHHPEVGRLPQRHHGARLHRVTPVRRIPPRQHHLDIAQPGRRGRIDRKRRRERALRAAVQIQHASIGDAVGMPMSNPPFAVLAAIHLGDPQDVAARLTIHRGGGAF
jgi:deazaflavin-dependent oxidoreductase (nitroreductase family)